MSSDHLPPESGSHLAIGVTQVAGCCLSVVVFVAVLAATPLRAAARRLTQNRSRARRGL